MHIIPDNTEEMELEEEQEREDLPEGVELLASFFIEAEDGSLLPSPNIADLFGKDTLMKVGRQVMEGFTADEQSMQEWSGQVEFGLDLAKQETESRSDPWDGAANFKSPSLMNAALKFSDRASTELLRGDDIAKVAVIGSDPQGQKAARGERVSKFQNWQLNVQMEEWREEHEKLLYSLPYSGSGFKKSFFDSRLGRISSTLVLYPNFVVNNNTTSMAKLRRFSEEFELSHNEVESRMRQGIWMEVSIGADAETDEDAPTDKPTTFVEQQGFFDLDDDGYEEPYTFVIAKETQQVVRIIPRFEAADVLVKDDVNLRASTLDRLIDAGLPETDGEREVVRIKPNNNITKYGFLPDPEGGFLDVGYTHILSALTAGINTTTNQLLDAGTLSNLPAAWLAKGFRRKMGSKRIKPGALMQTEISAQDLQNGIKLLPFKEPSPTLFQLMQFMVANSQELSASADLAQSLGANAPAATTLALVQEQQLSAGAIILRMYRAMAKEFRKQYELNGKFGDQEEYAEILDDPDAEMEADFNIRDMNIVPVANPELSSKIQRIQQAQAELSQAELVQITGGDLKVLVKNFLRAIGAQNIDEIYPELGPVEQLQELLAQNPDLMALILNENQRQDMIAAAEAQAIKQAQDNEDIKFLADIAVSKSVIEKNQASVQETGSKIAKNRASAILDIEKAETEDVKNQIDKFTAAEAIDGKRLDNERSAVEIQRAREGKESL